MPSTLFRQAKILIIDDEKANVRLLEMILQGAGYTNLHSTTDSLAAQSLFLALRPDAVLLDLAMPRLDGYEVMRLLQEEMAKDKDAVPILVLTADATSGARHRALGGGARDFLTKPLDETEVLLRLNNLLESRFHSVLLESRVQERTRELEQAQLETLQRLALAAEYRDDDTGMHTKRVGVTSALLAGLLQLSDAQVELVLRAAPLHDVGKIGIADAILLKKGKLTEEEFVIMKSHTLIGAQMLSDSTSPWLCMAEEIALSHHERWVGGGYPRGLAGEDISLVGRIVAVADVFDALTHERPYKTAWPIAVALTEIESQSGRHFDPRVVAEFVTLNHANLV